MKETFSTLLPHNFHRVSNNRKSSVDKAFGKFSTKLPLSIFIIYYFNMKKFYFKFVKLYADLSRKFIRLLKYHYSKKIIENITKACTGQKGNV